MISPINSFDLLHLNMLVQNNISLKPYNTFGLNVQTKNFISVTNTAEFADALKVSETDPYLILGGGSNVLFTEDFGGTVIQNKVSGISEFNHSGNSVLIEVMGGVEWHYLVLYTLGKGYGGLENLALIPGTAGAAPIQNIGAYGVEVKDKIKFVKTYCLSDHTERIFTSEECYFGYRTSRFKTSDKGKYFILSVTFELTIEKHLLNISYEPLKRALENSGIVHPGPADIAKSVIQIRQSKLPDPALLGNCGSFFKNPVLSASDFKSLFPEPSTVPLYKVSENEIKIPAGWLIEQCGWKGKKIGNAGMHKDQALVLVNYGDATGTELLVVAKSVKKSVYEAFGIHLEPEVNIIDGKGNIIQL